MEPCKEVRVVFSEHDSLDIPFLAEAFGRNIRDLLNKDPEKRVYALIECNNCGERMDAVTVRVNSGALPSIAYLEAAHYLFTGQVVKDPIDLQKWERVNGVIAATPFLAGELEVLDQISADPKYQGRLGLIIENRPDNAVINQTRELEAANQKRAKAINLVQQGQFSGAGRQLSSVAKTYARVSGLREEAVIQKTAKYLAAEDTAGVVILFGHSHPDIAADMPRLVGEEVVTVTSEYITRGHTGDEYLLDPFSVITLRLKAAEGKISDWEWENAAIADAIWGTLYEMGKGSGIDYHIVTRIVKAEFERRVSALDPSPDSEKAIWDQIRTEIKQDNGFENLINSIIDRFNESQKPQ